MVNVIPSIGRDPVTLMLVTTGNEDLSSGNENESELSFPLKAAVVPSPVNAAVFVGKTSSPAPESAFTLKIVKSNFVSVTLVITSS